MKKIHESFSRFLVSASLLVSLLFGSYPGFATAAIVVGPPQPNPQNSSVAFLPGIEGSRLFNASPVLFGTPDDLWEPLFNAKVSRLFLDTNGKSINPNVYVDGIIDRAVLPVIGPKIYQSFIETMDDLAGRRIISEWRALPYDWRIDINDIVDNGVNKNHLDSLGNNYLDYMVDNIENLADSSFTGKVTIVAHSMGGLVAKVLIDRLAAKGEANLIDKLVLVAVPELGTPQAIGAILNGSGAGIGVLGLNMFLTESNARSLAANSPGAYQLLPSPAYFSKVSDPVVEFDPSIDPISNLRNSYGNTIADSAKLANFLTAAIDHRTAPASDDIMSPLVANAGLLAKATALHSQIDTMAFPANIQVTQIAGWGLNTIRGIKYTKKTEDICTAAGVCGPVTFVDNQPLFVEDGDGTVVTPSATAVSAPTYYLDIHSYNNGGFHFDHKDLFEITPLLDFVKNIILSSTNIPNFFSSVKPSPSSQQKSIRLSAHSPVTIDFYDNQGRHTGLIPNPNPDSDLQLYESNIPNSYYLPFGEGKYAGFDESIPTQVKIAGTDTGTFTLNSEEVVGGKVKTSAVFTDIPVLPTTEATVSFDSSGMPTLSVDTNGDGTVDQTIKAKQDFDPVAFLQAMRKAVIGFNLKKNIEKDLLAKIDDMIKKIQKGKIPPVTKKIQSFLRGVQKDRNDHGKGSKQKHHKKMSDSEVQEIVAMLNTLLDNLK